MKNINVNLNFNSWKRIITIIKVIGLIVLFTITTSCISMRPIVKDTFDSKYYRLKKTFAWMNPEVYGIITTEVNKQRSKISIQVDYVKLISAVISAESGEYCHNNYEWMKYVVSKSGAVGIMQIMKVHTPNDPDSRKDPKINIQKGVMYFTYCLQKSIKEGYKNPVQIACAYYNAGAGVKLWRYRNWSYVTKIQKYYTI